jgi:hypothetical protein
MLFYINLDTLEYPRFPGDLLLDPLANWATVEESERPLLEKYQVLEEEFPQEKDGKWYQSWTTREMTIEEKAKVDSPQPGPLHTWDSNTFSWILSNNFN